MINAILIFQIHITYLTTIIINQRFQYGGWIINKHLVVTHKRVWSIQHSMTSNGALVQVTPFMHRTVGLRRTTEGEMTEVIN